MQKNSGAAEHAERGYLPDAYDSCIIVWMRTTLNIDDELLAEARKFTGEKEKTALVHLGLRALIEREASKRLARLGATMPKLRIAPRRR